MEILEGVLKAFGVVLEGLDGVLEAMLDQNSTKMTNKSKTSEKPWKNPRKSTILERVFGPLAKMPEARVVPLVASRATPQRYLSTSSAA